MELKRVTGTRALLTRMLYDELSEAQKKFPPFNSAHEGFAVLKGEVDELWEAIKNNESEKCMAQEAIQVAAMALRFVNDVTWSVWLEQAKVEGARGE
jgi:hypothetical protein